VFVAEVDGRAEAFIDLQEDGHIDMMFCAPEHAGQGLAAQLFSSLEQEARRRGLPRLHVEASEMAKPFFERRGFALVRRNDFMLEGVPIHNYHMEKLLR
jgi:putative acetyltransferase